MIRGIFSSKPFYEPIQSLKSIPIPVGIGVIVSQILGSGVVCAASSGIVTRSFSAQAPMAPQNPEARATLVSKVSGSAQFHPTGYVHLQYTANVDIYDGNCRLASCDQRLNVLFILYNEHGHIIGSFTESHVHAGTQNKTVQLDKEIVAKVHAMKVTVSYS